MKRVTNDEILFILDLNGTLLHRITQSQELASVRRHPRYRDPDTRVNGCPIYFRPGLQKFLTELFKLGEVGVWTSATPKNAVPMTVKSFGGMLDLDRLKLQMGEPAATLIKNYFPKGFVHDRPDGDEPGTKSLVFLWTQEECIRSGVTKISRSFPNEPIFKSTDKMDTNVVMVRDLWKPSFCKDLDRVWQAFPRYSAKNTIIIDDSPDKIRDHQCNHLHIGTFSVCQDSLEFDKDNQLDQLIVYISSMLTLIQSGKVSSVQSYLKEYKFKPSV